MIRTLLVDDHKIVREGLKRILDEYDDFTSVEEASTGWEALDLARSQSFEVVILDIALPGMDGLETLKQLKQEFSRLPVLILSMYPEDQYALRVLRAGASGYVTKDRAPEELVDALRKVVAGGKYITPSLAEHLAESVQQGVAEQPYESLSDRELQVFRQIAAGKSVGEIASVLSLSVKTVSTYRRRLLSKMGMKTNAEVIRFAIENRLVE